MPVLSHATSARTARNAIPWHTSADEQVVEPLPQRELDKIRALLNRMDLEKIHAMVLQVAPPEETDEEAASNSGSGKATVTGGKR